MHDEPEKLPQHFMATARVGPKGQIVIPKEIRDMFGIVPGDYLLVMADSARGIALHRQDVMEGLAKSIFEGKGAELLPREDQAGLDAFAAAIRGAAGGAAKGGREATRGAEDAEGEA